MSYNGHVIVTMSSDKRRVAVTVDGVTHQFRPVTFQEFADSEEALAKAKRRGPKFRELAQITCVSDLEALQKSFQKRPFLPTKIRDELLALAGEDAQVATEGEVVTAKLDGMTLTFRSPTLDEFEDHQERLAEQPRVECFKLLAEACCTSQPEALARAIALYPAMLTPVHEALLTLAGAGIEFTTSKG